MKKRIVFVVIYFFYTVATAQRVIVLDDKKNSYSPKNDFYQIFEDTSRVIGIATIGSVKYDTLFKGKNSLGDYTNANKYSAYWTRLSVKTSSIDKVWTLELIDPHIEQIDVFDWRDGKPRKISPTLGFAHSFAIKNFSHKNYVYSLDLSDGKVHTYYIHFNSRTQNSFIAKLQSPEYLVSYSVTEYFLLGLYYGILVIMAIYNLFIYFSVREKTYIYYVLYVIACGFNSMNEDGLGFQFLWQEYPAFNSLSSYYMPAIMLIAFMLYSTSFLRLKEKNVLYYKIAYVLVLVYCFFIIVNILFLGAAYRFQILYLLPFAFIYLAAIKVVWEGYKPAKYFLFGYSFILLSIIIFYLRIKGIQPFGHLFAVYSFNYGFIAEVVILSYALSERLKDEKSQKEKAQKIIINELEEKEKLKDELNKELERKVFVRTQELEVANKEISRMNEFLAQHNLKLQEDVKYISKERIMQREVSFDEFKKTYPDEQACYQFLAELKWARSFGCKKCGYERYTVLANYTRRCNKCKYVESPTAFTIFHSLKFSLLDAFYMLFLINGRKDITAEELSATIQLSERSCASFKRKVAIAEKNIKGKSKDKSGWERLIPYYEEE